MTSLVTKGNKEECLANVKVVSLYAKRFGIGQWSFIGPGSEKVVFCRELGIILRKNVIGIRRKRTSYFPCNDSIVQWYSQDHKTWKTVNTLRCR